MCVLLFFLDYFTFSVFFCSVENYACQAWYFVSVSFERSNGNSFISLKSGKCFIFFSKSKSILRKTLFFISFSSSYFRPTLSFQIGHKNLVAFSKVVVVLDVVLLCSCVRTSLRPSVRSSCLVLIVRSAPPECNCVTFAHGGFAGEIVCVYVWLYVCYC